MFLLIEYNGEMLTLNAIATREKIDRDALNREYEKKGNIYDAVKTCKENQLKWYKNTEGVEYNGKMVSFNVIAITEGINGSSLKREYEETGNIYEAVKICKENKLRRNGNIEYKGEFLTINAIATMEEIIVSSLKREYDKTGDIYEAVKICKGNQLKKHKSIEYNGEYLTINAIASMEKVVVSSLRREYDKTGNIYEAIKICKENQLKKNGYIEYNGEYLTINAIATREKIDVHALTREYDKTRNIYDAVKICKENQLKKNGYIEYYEEYLTITAIATKEKITTKTLKREYDTTGDIYEAVKIYKEKQLKRNGNIEYYGEHLTIAAIAEREEISKGSLKREYDNVGNIYEAVKVCKDKKLKYNGNIEYYGEYLTLTAIAAKEKVTGKSLKKEYDRTGNIYVAVEKCKYRQQNISKNNPKIRKGKSDITIEQIISGNNELQFEDVLLILGLTPEEYKDLLELKIFSIKDTIKEAKEKITKYNTKNKNGANRNENTGALDSKIKQQLRNLAINPECIEYRMLNQGMSLERAIDDYCKKGQKDPTYFKFTKNDVLLKHFLLYFGINSSEILELMRNNYVTLGRAFQYVTIENLCEGNSDYFKIIYDYFTNGSGEELILNNTELAKVCKKYRMINRKFNIVNALYELKTGILEQQSPATIKRKLVDTLFEYNIERLSDDDIEFASEIFYSDFNSAGVLDAPTNRGNNRSNFFSEMSEKMIKEFRGIINGVNIELVRRKTSERYRSNELDSVVDNLNSNFTNVTKKNT